MNQGKQQLRIIAGLYRGRRWLFPDAPGLRPTTDRIRETLFNWLQGDIQNARCLDVFTGSGALGLEAASRGAGDVILVDNNPVVISGLQAVIKQWQAVNIKTVCADALVYLGEKHAPFDIVFLDPPFHQDTLGHCLNALLTNDCIHPQSLLYIESSVKSFVLPEGLDCLRHKTAGQVSYGLYQLC